MLLEATPPDYVDLAYIDALLEEEDNQQKTVQRNRAYYDGIDGKLTDRLEEFLTNDHVDAAQFNICRLVVDAVDERLGLQGFIVSDNGGNSPTGSYLSDFWDRISNLQDDVHRLALAERESFAILDFVDGEVGFIPHPRYVSLDNGGDGYGVFAVYENGDINARMLAAVKQWGERIKDGEGKTKIELRRTVYYPERIERYRMLGDWTAIEDDDIPFPLDWTDGAGNPLGIPVIHFKNDKFLSEFDVVITDQNTYTKHWLDLITAGDSVAHAINVFLGFIPTTDGRPLNSSLSNQLTIAPGKTIATTTPRTQAEVIRLQGDAKNIEATLEIIRKIELTIGVKTGTPLSRFTMSRQVASGETLREQNEPLFAKVEKRQANFGVAWRQVAKMVIKLANHFGGAGLPDDVEIKPSWQSIHKLNGEEVERLARMDRENGVPRVMIWKKRLGYSDDEIEIMMQSLEYQAHLASLSLDVGMAG